MFIEYIKIKNFGNVKEEFLTLTNGLVVVRGANGKGKTTSAISAPNYAFWGSSTLDAPLADTV